MRSTRRSKLSQKPFPCEKCGRSYGRMDTLRRHLQYECGQLPRFDCAFCPRSFKHKAHYRRHAASVHGMQC